MPIFHVISKDTGFDPLINHLKTKKIKVQREKDISEIPILKPPVSKTITENVIIKISEAKSENENYIFAAMGLPIFDGKIDIIINFLIASKNAKQRTEKTLANSINSLFKKQLSQNEIENLIKEISNRKIISIMGNKVSYSLPK
jgi:hypothetical protein